MIKKAVFDKDILKNITHLTLQLPQSGTDLDDSCILNDQEMETLRDDIEVLHRLIKKTKKKNNRKKTPSKKQIAKQNRREQLQNQAKDEKSLLYKKIAEQIYITSQTLEDCEGYDFGKLYTCYVCKNKFDKIHNFYDKMCVKCGDENYAMRKKNRDLTGWTALVTGGRVKIGYEIVLWLLRNNCKVIVTTRFPADALLRYKKETDYEIFKERLTLCGLDFKNFSAVYAFMKYIEENYLLDILINNAAQTLTRSDSYNMQLQNDELFSVRNMSEIDKTKIGFNWLPNTNEFFSIYNEKDKNDIFKENVISVKKDFSIYDCNNIPICVEPTNSWTLKLEDVSFKEFAETQIVNLWVPFEFCKRFSNIMGKNIQHKAFIINVSAMEGVFNYKFKKIFHPHTNMAKASLNMLVKTSGPDLKKKNIYMTAVECGWASEMNPDRKIQLTRTVPLDEVDSAMRILHPVFDDLDAVGVLLKDYKIRELW